MHQSSRKLPAAEAGETLWGAFGVDQSRFTEIYGVH